MLLSASMIACLLPQSFHARLRGKTSAERVLSRPKLLEVGSEKLEDRGLYVARIQRLPHRIAIGNKVTLVCLGSSGRLSYFADRCSVIEVDANVDFYALFNSVQSIFDRFDTWERDLQRLLETEAGIEAMLEASYSVFGNPMHVIDSNFLWRGYVNKKGVASSAPDSVDGPAVQFESIDEFLRENDVRTHDPAPIILEYEGEQTLNVNLLDEGRFLGCLTIVAGNRDFNDSDIQASMFLSEALVKMIGRMEGSGEGLGPLREALRGLVFDGPLGTIGRIAIDAASQGRCYVCARFSLSHSLSRLPLPYFCSAIERFVPNSMAFEYNPSTVVSFIDLSCTTPDIEGAKRLIGNVLTSFTSTSSVKVGLSEPMASLSQTRQHFMQATIALETGELHDPDRQIYPFDEYVLSEMIMNSLGGMTLEMFMPKGLRDLQELDERTGSEFVKTLETFLRNNMGATHAANELLIHRSTLLQRIDRITKILGTDLDDYNVRLRLMMLLKARTLQDELQERIS